MKKFFLFQPITINLQKLQFSDKWITKVAKWCEKTGSYYDHGRYFSTFDSDTHPHELDWMIEVLQQICPMEKFNDSWVQVYKPNGFHDIHNHTADDNVISGCVYLKSNKSSVWQNPLYPSKHIRIPVQKGDTIFWDPNLYHSSPPDPAERIILAFNLNEKLESLS